jgi:branched-chain amino acid transport system substrate-binding protein
MGIACLTLVLLVLVGCSMPPSSEPELPQTGVGPGDAEVFGVAEVLRRNGRSAEALQAFADFIEQFPDSPLGDDARLAIGQVAAELGRPNDAVAAYKDLIGNFPDSELRAEAFLGLGRLRYEQEDYTGSWVALQGALDASPTPAQRARAYYHLGTASFALQTYREAGIELAVAAVADDPNLAEKARNLLGRIVRNHLGMPQLEHLANRFATAFPGDLFMTELAERHRASGDVQAEIDALYRLSDAFPDRPDADVTLERLQTLEALLGTDSTKLGVLLPLSGSTGQIGRSALQSVQLALDTLQQRHADLDLSLVIRDTGATTETARGALRALVEEAHVIGVIGPLLSQTAEGLALLADELGVPLISPFARDSQFPQLSPYTFRNSLTDAMQGRLLASYATQELARRRFAILYPDDAYGTALADHFRAALDDYNGRVVVRAAYPPDAQDVGRAVQRIRTRRYDALLVPDYADNIARLAPELAYDAEDGVQLLGTDGWNDPEIATLAAWVVDGSVFVDGFHADSSVPHVEAFVSDFRERYGAVPDLLAAQAYDTLMMCAEVLRTGARSRPELRDGLARIRDFPGVSGVTSMDADGDAEKVLYLLSVREGRIIQINAPAFQYPDAGDPAD